MPLLSRPVAGLQEPSTAHYRAPSSISSLPKTKAPIPCLFGLQEQSVCVEEWGVGELRIPATLLHRMSLFHPNWKSVLLEQRLKTGGLWARFSSQTCFIWPTQWLIKIWIGCQPLEIENCFVWECIKIWISDFLKILKNLRPWAPSPQDDEWQSC